MAKSKTQLPAIVPVNELPVGALFICPDDLGQVWRVIETPDDEPEGIHCVDAFGAAQDDMNAYDPPRTAYHWVQCPPWNGDVEETICLWQPGDTPGITAKPVLRIA